MGRKSISYEGFIKRLNDKFGNKFELLDDYINMETPIRFICNDCQSVIYMRPSKLLMNKYGCCQCYHIINSTPKVGVNDLWTTHSDIATLLKNPEDGYRYSYGSNQRSIFKCPICGYEEERYIYAVVRDGFYCQYCADGISYPNKLFRALFSQQHISYIPEWSPDFIKPMAYDFYFKINGIGYVVEADGGLGHGYQKTTSKAKCTKEESIKRDKYKEQMAADNNIVVIRIDCNYPNINNRLDYIKNNIMQSSLKNLLDIQNINWSDCDKFATSSLIYKVSELWDSGVHEAKEIASILNLTSTCVISYLRKSERFGISSYCHKEYVNKMRIKSMGYSVAKTSISVQCIETQEIFSSISEANQTYHCLVGKYLSGKSKYAGKLEDGTKLHWLQLS